MLETQLLKLHDNKLPSDVAFNFNSRHYTLAIPGAPKHALATHSVTGPYTVRWCKFPQG